MTTEATHEVGRSGVIEAKSFLERVLGGTIGLPFNVYDNPEKLTFAGCQELALPGFAMDLRGHLSRDNRASLAGREVAEVLAEVKTYTSGGALLTKYAEFLRRAGCIAQGPAHRTTWFIFLATSPFGTTKGSALSDGAFLRKQTQDWPQAARTACADLHKRVVVFIADPSMKRLLEYWPPSHA
jgi:hypothetical protein